MITRNKVWFGVTTVIYTVLFFIFSGSLRFIKTDFKGLTKSRIIKDFYTIGNFEILFLILATSIIGAIYFMNKNEQLQARLEDKKDRIIYFKESLNFLLVPIVLACIVNFFVKVILFVLNIEILIGKFEIPFYVIFNVIIYIFVIAFLGVSVSLLFQITIKSVLAATLYPLIIVESFILIFGVSNLFVTDKIPFIKVISNFTSNLVLNYLNMFASNLRVEMLGTSTFFITILALLAITLLCLACSSRFLITYREGILNYNYRSIFLRRSILLVMVTVVVMYFSLAIFAGYSLLVINSITLDKAFEYVEILSVILIPTITIFIDYLYMKRNNLISKKDSKIKNGEKNKKNFNLEKNTKNENTLKSKGITKETVEVNCLLESNYIKEFDDSKEYSELECAISYAEIENDDIFFKEEIIIKENLNHENIDIETNHSFIKEDNK